MTDDPPSPALTAALRDQAFEEILETSDKAASYARSLSEAAFRGDEATMVAHMKQLRLCCLSIIGTYKQHMNGAGARADGTG